MTDETAEPEVGAFYKPKNAISGLTTGTFGVLSKDYGFELSSEKRNYTQVGQNDKIFLFKCDKVMHIVDKQNFYKCQFLWNEKVVYRSLLVRDFNIWLEKIV